MTFTDATRVLGKDPLQYGALGLLGIGILAVLWSNQNQASIESEERIRMQKGFTERTAEVRKSIDDLRNVIVETVAESNQHQANREARRTEILVDFIQGVTMCREPEANLPEPQNKPIMKGIE